MALYAITKEPYAYRQLEKSEVPSALSLALEVFSEFEAPVYPEEGTAEFLSCLGDEKYLSGIEYYGAFDGETLVGIIGFRQKVRHICFFFVKGSYHRRGIGTKLFLHLLGDTPHGEVTVNSSPFGLPFYKSLGFAAAGREQTVNGIRFTPMKYTETEEKI
ncbi:MAG: GNAT family N-acetyltransferase [Clostridia bacterium]|nr:GNAT family N-acetyltransferase [Clostridia bacterium]